MLFIRRRKGRKSGRFVMGGDALHQWVGLYTYSRKEFILSHALVFVFQTLEAFFVIFSPPLSHVFNVFYFFLST